MASHWSMVPEYLGYNMSVSLSLPRRIKGTIVRILAAVLFIGFLVKTVTAMFCNLGVHNVALQQEPKTWPQTLTEMSQHNQRANRSR